MARIQIRRQLKYAHPREEALEYIRTKLIGEEKGLASGEPLLCTYKNSNGQWGAIEVICVYPHGMSRKDTILSDSSYDDYFDTDNRLINNFLKVNDNEWDEI